MACEVEKKNESKVKICLEDENERVITWLKNVQRRLMGIFIERICQAEDQAELIQKKRFQRMNFNNSKKVSSL